MLACPVCKRRTATTPEGRLARHGHRAARRCFIHNRPPCEGSGTEGVLDMFCQNFTVYTLVALEGRTVSRGIEGKIINVRTLSPVLSFNVVFLEGSFAVNATDLTVNPLRIAKLALVE